MRNPQVAQAFQAQSVPTVVAVLAGQPLPLFQGAYPGDQVRAVLDQVLAAAEANGITGASPRAPRRRRAEVEPSRRSRSCRRCTRRRTTRSSATTSTPRRAAYEQALRENPRDDAGPGRAGAGRPAGPHRGRRPPGARAPRPRGPRRRRRAARRRGPRRARRDRSRTRSAGSSTLVRATRGAERERVRLRLVDLFEVVGGEDPRVSAARRAIANALY